MNQKRGRNVRRSLKTLIEKLIRHICQDRKEMMGEADLRFIRANVMYMKTTINKIINYLNMLINTVLHISKERY